MKGDFSRLTTRCSAPYAGVRLQQGRVMLDADFNEQMDLLEQFLYEQMDAILGGTGTPSSLSIPGSGKGFKVNRHNAQTLSFTPGRYYVAGRPISCVEENGTEPLRDMTQLNIDGTGIWLIYLDTWQRTVTMAEDPSFYEPALGGVDSAVRVKTEWAIRARLIEDDSDLTIEAQLEALTRTRLALAFSVGQAVNRSNQLYRVEVHEGGDSPTFKWSIDNGAETMAVVDSSYSSISPSGWVTLELRGRQVEAVLSNGCLLELIQEGQRSGDAPGWLVRVKGMDGSRVSFESVSEQPPGWLQRTSNRSVLLARKWDGVPSFNDTLKAELSPEADRLGISQVWLDTGEDPSTGQYWTFSTRQASESGGSPARQPDGPVHRYAALAVVNVKAQDDSQSFTFSDDVDDILDKRRVFALVTDRDAVLKTGDHTMLGGLTVRDLQVKGGVILGEGSITIRGVSGDTELTITDLNSPPSLPTLQAVKTYVDNRTAPAIGLVQTRTEPPKDVSDDSIVAPSALASGLKVSILKVPQILLESINSPNYGWLASLHVDLPVELPSVQSLAPDAAKFYQSYQIPGEVAVSATEVDNIYELAWTPFEAQTHWLNTVTPKDSYRGNRLLARLVVSSSAIWAKYRPGNFERVFWIGQGEVISLSPNALELKANDEDSTLWTGDLIIKNTGSEPLKDITKELSYFRGTGESPFSIAPDPTDKPVEAIPVNESRVLTVTAKLEPAQLINRLSAKLSITSAEATSIVSIIKPGLPVASLSTTTLTFDAVNVERTFTITNTTPTTALAVRSLVVGSTSLPNGAGGRGREIESATNSAMSRFTVVDPKGNFKVPYGTPKVITIRCDVGDNATTNSFESTLTLNCDSHGGTTTLALQRPARAVILPDVSSFTFLATESKTVMLMVKNNGKADLELDNIVVSSVNTSKTITGFEFNQGRDVMSSNDSHFTWSPESMTIKAGAYGNLTIVSKIEDEDDKKRSITKTLMLGSATSGVAIVEVTLFKPAAETKMSVQVTELVFTSENQAKSFNITNDSAVALGPLTAAILTKDVVSGKMVKSTGFEIYSTLAKTVAKGKTTQVTIRCLLSGKGSAEVVFTADKAKATVKLTKRIDIH